MPVYVNIENGIAAMALAQIAGVSNEEIKSAMPTFGGVDRRFDFKIKEDNLVFLSDYAHHPAEIKQSISSIKALYPDKKLQLYSSRTYIPGPETSIKNLQKVCHWQTKLYCLTFILPESFLLKELQAS